MLFSGLHMIQVQNCKILLAPVGRALLDVCVPPRRWCVSHVCLYFGDVGGGVDWTDSDA